MAELTWDAASDWDSPQAESNVVHETFGDKDGGTVQVGYPTDLPVTPNMLAYYPLDEDSGTTAAEVVNDAGTNFPDFTYDGNTLGQAGLLGGTAPSSDGSDDRIYQDTVADFGWDRSGSWAIACWVLTRSFESGSGVTNDRMFKMLSGYFGPYVLAYPDGTWSFRMYDGSTVFELSPPIKDDSQWHHYIFQGDGSTMYLYEDNSLYNSKSYNVDTNTGDAALYGNTASGGSPDGKMEDMMVFDGMLDSSDRDYLYNTVRNGTGSITTKKKTS